MGQTAMKTYSWVNDNDNSDNMWYDQMRYQDSRIPCKRKMSGSIGGSVVECSPATRAARVRYRKDHCLPDGELNPGLPRDRRGY